MCSVHEVNRRKVFTFYKILPLIVFSLVGFLYFSQNAFAASSQLVLYEGFFFGVENEDYVVTAIIEDGGTYPLELGIEHSVIIGSEGNFFEWEGYLYRSSDSPERELVEHIGGFDGVDRITFLNPGEYELDVYRVPPPEVSVIPWWKNLLSAITPPTAYAQSSTDFIETIRFTITDIDATAECCSSVLFLPGIKGSVLKRDKLIGSDTLWPPTIWSNDVAQLALTAEGESTHDIFVDGILEKFVIEPVYSEFTLFMDELVTEGAIAGWFPFAYDWRFALEDVLEDGVKTAGDNIDLIEKIEELAEGSDTGQVTIVAHSMGGLLGKVLIKKLEEGGKAEIIDSFVMVGSPQLGTPKAITALLHGDGEGIPSNRTGITSVLNNSFVDASVARSIAHNMPSSHVLLPGAEYFTRVTDPVISFDPEVTSTETWRNIWGDTISTLGGLQTFLTDDSNRNQPSEDALKSPYILRENLVSDASTFHSVYDSYDFPEHIRVVEVAGWGIPTIKGVKYTEEHGELDYRPMFTVEGDSTVVYTSAVSSNKEVYYFDAGEFQKDEGILIEHKDLLRAAPIQSLLEFIYKEDVIEAENSISSSKPMPTETTERLLVSAHSPVVLGARDTANNFTGIEGGEIVEDIPGSSYQIFGGSQYIFLPKEGEYEFEYQGVGNGQTTIRISEFSNDAENQIASFSNIETTDQTIASFTVDSATPESIAIKIDTDGDGSIEDTVVADGTEGEEYTTVHELLALIYTKLGAIDDRKFVRRTDKLVKKLERKLWLLKYPWFEKKLMKEGENILWRIQKLQEQQKSKWWDKWW